MKATLQHEPRADQERTERHIAPEVNIYEDKDGYILEAEMPGVNKDGLEITLEGTEITITGRRNVPAMKGDSLFRESQPANFRRVFSLDPVIDTGRINAKMDQGVLTLTLPKSEKVKPKRIQVD
jgi:HSP20 family protein